MGRRPRALTCTPPSDAPLSCSRHPPPCSMQERELGNDAYAAGAWDAAVAHYSRALGDPLGAADASLHSNRAAAYLAKGW